VCYLDSCVSQCALASRYEQRHTGVYGLMQRRSVYLACSNTWAEKRSERAKAGVRGREEKGEVRRRTPPLSTPHPVQARSSLSWARLDSWLDTTSVYTYTYSRVCAISSLETYHMLLLFCMCDKFKSKLQLQIALQLQLNIKRHCNRKLQRLHGSINGIPLLKVSGGRRLGSRIFACANDVPAYISQRMLRELWQSQCTITSNFMQFRICENCAHAIQLQCDCICNVPCSDFTSKRVWWAWTTTDRINMIIKRICNCVKVLIC